MSVFTQVSFNDLIVSGIVQQDPDQKRLGLSVSILCFTFDNGSSVGLRFSSPAALSDFCKKHNFDFEDDRLKHFDVPKGSDYGKQGLWVGAFDRAVNDYLEHLFKGAPKPTRNREFSSPFARNGYLKGLKVMKEITEKYHF